MVAHVYCLRGPGGLSPGVQGQPGKHRKTLSLTSPTVLGVLAHASNPSTRLVGQGIQKFKAIFDYILSWRLA